MITKTVKTQKELDSALLAKVKTIYIDSPAGIWLSVGKDVQVIYSRVVARESSRVEAWGSSRVVASKYVAIHLHSAKAKIEGGVLIDLTQINLENPQEWLEYHGVKIEDGSALLYKAVNDKFQTDRGSEWTYAPGNAVTAKDFKPTRECGHGLHFGITPRHARTFHSDATRFVAVHVKIEGLIPLDDKCKVANCEVLYEVDIDGDEMVKE